jgi:hypothetical protein
MQCSSPSPRRKMTKQIGFMRAVQIAAIVMALVVPSLSSAQLPPGISIGPTPAPYVSPFIGLEATGGSVAECSAGQVMVGVAGIKLKFIKSLTPLCGSFNKDGSFTGVAPLDPSATLPAAPGFRLQCARGHTATRVRVSYSTSNSIYQFLGGVEIGCSLWLISQWTGAPQPIASLNFDSWPVKASVACNEPTQPIRTLRIRATTSVKALSIICKQL